MKKIVTSLLIVALLFNFICCRNVVYADPDQQEGKGSGSAYTEDAPVSNEGPTEILESGTASKKQGGATKATLGIGSAFSTGIGMVTGIVARLINIFAVQIDVLMGVMTASEEDGTSQFWFSLDRVVFNRVPLFNANYFDTESEYKVGDDLVISANTSNIEIKNGIIDVYKICRTLAMILSLLVLIYIGIRMALSTVASDQAKYKKMFTSWLESIVILFCMVYIMVAIMAISEALVGVFYKIRCELIASNHGYGVFEDTVRSEVWEKVFSFSGLQLTMWSIIYWCLLFSEIKFFWLYAKRLLMMGLLVIVSPLIIITYSIDKAGDGRAQVFSAWMNEFIVNALIQPLHALIYLIFILTANTIAKQSPIVALALLMSMGTVEKMVKVVFNLKDLATLKPLNSFLKKEG